MATAEVLPPPKTPVPLTQKNLLNGSLRHPADTRPAHLDHFSTFKDWANQAFKGAYPKIPTPRYTAAHVLLLYWAEDDLGVASEVTGLNKVLEEQFHFNTQTFVIPTEDAEDAVVARVLRFRKQFSNPDHLLIVYYGGHAERAEHDHCIWRRQVQLLPHLRSTSASNLDEDEAQVDWNIVQPFLLSTDADCLILLDCCYAAKGAKDAGTLLRGTNEIIAACGPESRTTGVERQSFTSVLTRQLETFAHEHRKYGRKFTAVGLHSALFRFSRELRYGPFYVRLTNKEFSSIDVSPLPVPRIDNTDDDSGIEMASTQDSSLSASEAPPPVLAKVLLSIHLTEEPRGDLVAFLKDEGLIPQYVSGMEIIGIEDIHISNSTLAIVSVPIEIWDLLPEEAPCTFVGIVYSENLLLGHDEDELWREPAGHGTVGTPARFNSTKRRHLVERELAELQNVYYDLKEDFLGANLERQTLAEAKARLELRCADLESQLTSSSEAKSRLESKCTDLESQLPAMTDTRRVERECLDIKQHLRKTEEVKRRLERELEGERAAKASEKIDREQVNTVAASVHASSGPSHHESLHRSQTYDLPGPMPSVSFDDGSVRAEEHDAHHFDVMPRGRLSRHVSPSPTRTPPRVNDISALAYERHPVRGLTGNDAYDLPKLGRLRIPRPSPRYPYNGYSIPSPPPFMPDSYQSRLRYAEDYTEELAMREARVRAQEPQIDYQKFLAGRRAYADVPKPDKSTISTTKKIQEVKRDVRESTKSGSEQGSGRKLMFESMVGPGAVTELAMKFDDEDPAPTDDDDVDSGFFSTGGSVRRHSLGDASSSGFSDGRPSRSSLHRSVVSSTHDRYSGTYQSHSTSDNNGAFTELEYYQLKTMDNDWGLANVVKLIVTQDDLARQVYKHGGKVNRILNHMGPHRCKAIKKLVEGKNDAEKDKDADWQPAHIETAVIGGSGSPMYVILAKRFKTLKGKTSGREDQSGKDEKKDVTKYEHPFGSEPLFDRDGRPLNNEDSLSELIPRGELEPLSGRISRGD